MSWYEPNLKPKTTQNNPIFLFDPNWSEPVPTQIAPLSVIKLTLKHKNKYTGKHMNHHKTMQPKFKLVYKTQLQFSYKLCQYDHKEKKMQ